MVNIITEKTIITTEKIILQLNEKHFKDTVDDDNFAQYCRNVEKFASDKTGKDNLKVLDVRYKDNDMSSEVIEIEAERIEKVTL